MRRWLATLTMTTLLGIITVGSGAFGFGSIALARTDAHSHQQPAALASVDKPLRVLLMGDSLAHEAGELHSGALSSSGVEPFGAHA